MANNKIAFGLCEQHNIKLPKDATPRDAWEALKERGIVAGDDSSAKSSSIVPGRDKSPYKEQANNKHKERQSTVQLRCASLPTLHLPTREYAHVMSELATNLNAKQRKQPIVRKAIGDYIYVAENKGFGYYRIISKQPIIPNFFDDYEEG